MLSRFSRSANSRRHYAFASLRSITWKATEHNARRAACFHTPSSPTHVHNDHSSTSKPANAATWEREDESPLEGATTWGAPQYHSATLSEEALSTSTIISEGYSKEETSIPTEGGSIDAQAAAERECQLDRSAWAPGHPLEDNTPIDQDSFTDESLAALNSPRSNSSVSHTGTISMDQPAPRTEPLAAEPSCSQLLKVTTSEERPPQATTQAPRAPPEQSEHMSNPASMPNVHIATEILPSTHPSAKVPSSRRYRLAELEKTKRTKAPSPKSESKTKKQLKAKSKQTESLEPEGIDMESLELETTNEKLSQAVRHNKFLHAKLLEARSMIALALKNVHTKAVSTAAVSTRALSAEVVLPEAGHTAPEFIPLPQWQRRFSPDAYRSPGGRGVIVRYCTDRESAEQEARAFLKEKALGFDTEHVQGNIELLQLASESRIVLFQVGRFKPHHGEEPIPPTLKRILESRNILKCGVSVQNDASKLLRRFGVSCRGLLELSYLHHAVALDSARTDYVGLNFLVKEHLQMTMFLGRVDDSRWDGWRLTKAQQEYAAADAYAGLRVFDILERKRRAFRPMPPFPKFVEDLYKLKPATRSVPERDKVPSKAASAARSQDSSQQSETFNPSISSGGIAGLTQEEKMRGAGDAALSAASGDEPQSEFVNKLFREFKKRIRCAQVIALSATGQYAMGRPLDDRIHIWEKYAPRVKDDPTTSGLIPKDTRNYRDMAAWASIASTSLDFDTMKQYLRMMLSWNAECFANSSFGRPVEESRCKEALAILHARILSQFAPGTEGKPESAVRLTDEEFRYLMDQRTQLSAEQLLTLYEDIFAKELEGRASPEVRERRRLRQQQKRARLGQGGRRRSQQRRKRAEELLAQRLGPAKNPGSQGSTPSLVVHDLPKPVGSSTTPEETTVTKPTTNGAQLEEPNARHTDSLIVDGLVGPLENTKGQDVCEEGPKTRSSWKGSRSVIPEAVETANEVTKRRPRYRGKRSVMLSGPLAPKLITNTEQSSSDVGPTPAPAESLSEPSSEEPAAARYVQQYQKMREARMSASRLVRDSSNPGNGVKRRKWGEVDVKVPQESQSQSEPQSTHPPVRRFLSAMRLGGTALGWLNVLEKDNVEAPRTSRSRSTSESMHPAIRSTWTTRRTVVRTVTGRTRPRRRSHPRYKTPFVTRSIPVKFV